jgi:hypothetical protein
MLGKYVQITPDFLGCSHHKRKFWLTQENLSWAQARVLIDCKKFTVATIVVFGLVSAQRKLSWAQHKTHELSSLLCFLLF